METASSQSSALSSTSQSPSSSSMIYSDFLHKMRNPASVNLVRSIKSFIVSFTFASANPEDDGKRVQEFYSTMEAAISGHPLWADDTREQIDCAMEGLEKYLMTKLYSRTFAASSEDRKIDLELSEKIQLLQTFLRPEHLDIPLILQNEASWLLAEKEMLKINACKAPREKLLCILSCCRVINNLLLNASMSEHHLLGGADDFLPVLIYVTIKANPPQLHSNLKFIQLYHRQAKLVSSAAYYLTNLVSAKSFIEEINSKSLSIDEIDFEEGMQSARLTNNISQAEQVSKLGRVRGSGEGMVPDPSTRIDGKEAKFDMLDRSQYPYMEAKPGDLTVEDVEMLLSLYKEVVTKYTSHCRTVQQMLGRIGSSPLSEAAGAFLSQPDISTMKERTLIQQQDEEAESAKTMDGS